jgi:predicted phosphodiesterase
MKIGFISDAHGNVEAFCRGLAALEEFGAESVYFLGDAIGYLPGDAVVTEIRERGIPAIRGNHEEMLLRGEAPLNREPVYRLRQIAREMQPANRAEIVGWPAARTIDSAPGKLLLVHGSPSDQTFGYVYPESELDGFDVAPHVAVFMGNTHRPFVRHAKGVLFVNIGSCGLPRDTGDLGAACLFDGATGEARIIRFSIEAETRKALERCGAVADDVGAVFARRAKNGYVGSRIDAA